MAKNFYQLLGVKEPGAEASAAEQNRDAQGRFAANEAAEGGGRAARSEGPADADGSNNSLSQRGGADSSLMEGAKGPGADTGDGADGTENAAGGGVASLRGGRSAADQNDGSGEEGPEDAAPEEEAQGAPEGEKGQSKEENSKYAKARRKAERERDEAISRLNAEHKAALEKAKEDARNEVFQAFAAAGMVDPYTKKPITNLQEFEAYKQADAQAKADKFKRDNRLTDEQYRQMVEGLPEVQAARAQSAEAQRVLEAQKRAAQLEQIDRDLAEIAAMNPNIRSAEDLSHDPMYPKMLEYLNRNENLSILDAYRLTHFNELRGAAGQQQAINQAGKAHLTAMQSRGTGGELRQVPPDEMKIYRMLNPGKTDEEITRHYNAALRERDAG